MLEVWLVLAAIFCDQFSRGMRNHKTQEVFRMAALFFVLLSFILFFYNGGTTG